MFRVGKVPGKGRGLVATENIPEGRVLRSYPGGDDCFCMLVGDFRFANHSGEPNCDWSFDGKSITFTATRDITYGEEIAYDYACELWFVPTD